MIYLSDLPSAGDTSYAGIVRDGHLLYACYYTSDVRNDYPCALGMITASDIMTAKNDMRRVEKIALAKAFKE